MLTRILLVIVSVVYIILLILKFTKKGGAKIEGFVQTVQGILWAVIAFDNWSASSIVLKIAYLLLVFLSLASGIREFCKGNPA